VPTRDHDVDAEPDGVRSSEQVAKDMIAVRLGPDLRMAVVGAPSYVKTCPEPKRPQEICVCRPTTALYARVKRGNRERKVRVDGQLAFKPA
jgi:hypothetical protein